MYHPGMYHKKAKKTFVDPISKEPKKARSIYEKSYRELIPVLDREYSLYRRMSIAVSMAQSVPSMAGLLTCCTCVSVHHWKDLDLGHYITRAVMATRFDDRNTSPQCKKCNRFMNGRADLMREHLIKVHGEREIKSLEVKANLGNPWTAETLRAEIERIRIMSVQLRKELK